MTRRETPWERWSRDLRMLSYLSAEDLRDAFVVHFTRTASNDRIVPIDGVDYELPRALGPGGRKGQIVQITHHLLEDTFHVVCEGRLVRIHPVDLAANARSRRGRPDPASDEPQPPAAKTAADMAYERDMGPVVDADGSALDHHKEEDTQ